MLANVTAATITASVVGCDQPHNGEVYAAADLTATNPTWPGIRTIVDTSDSLCKSGQRHHRRPRQQRVDVHLPEAAPLVGWSGSRRCEGARVLGVDVKDCRV